MNKIIALWVHPRSLSTALERVFMERGDFKVLHEPFSYVFYVYEKRAPIPHAHIDPNLPQSYPDIKQWILDEGEKRQTFYKDMCFHAFDHLIKDKQFLKRITNTFLIRDPVKTILSHAAINPGVTCKEIGYEEELKIFQKVADLTGDIPVVVSAEDLEDNPEGVVEAYCDALGIPFIKEALSWEAGHKSEWDSWKEWHVDAAESIGIQKDMEKFTFTIDDKPHLKTYYEYHLPFYEALSKHTIKPYARKANTGT